MANLTLTGTDSSITFSSIPATYRDLVLVYDVKMSNIANLLRVRLNGDTGSNYSTVWAYGDGSNPLSAAETVTYLEPSVSGYTEFWGLLNLMDYSATDKHTTALSRSNNTGDYVVMSAHRWANTNAVTDIEVYSSAGTFNANSTFALYGIIS